MKKGLLFIIAMLLMVSAVEAKIIEKTGEKQGNNRYLKMKSIVFIEKGIQFTVLPNGKIKYKLADFKNNKNTRKHSFKYHNGIKILKNHKGQITNIGNVPIFYSRSNKITQIGSVDLKYKHGKLKKVGNLHIVYKQNGSVKYIGEVKQKHLNFPRKPLIWV